MQQSQNFRWQGLGPFTFLNTHDLLQPLMLFKQKNMNFFIHGPSADFGKWHWNKEFDNLLGNQGSISLLSSRLLDQRIQENKFVLIHWAPIECGTQSLLCWFQWWIVPLAAHLECLGQPLLQIRVTYWFYHVPMFECKKKESLN
jgi:hypothetical protein